LSLTYKAGYFRKKRFWGCRKNAWAGNFRIIGVFAKEQQLTQRAEKLLILFLMSGFFLFLAVCSCKNQNLIDPLDILDPRNPETWRVCGDCGTFTPNSQSRPVPPPQEGEVDICTGPNPTSEPICIQYVLPTEMNVSLAVYTQKGEKVATIVRQRQSAGAYFYQWKLEDDSGSPVDNGTYRAYFMAGSFTTYGDITVQR
jgi:hypothetical protein